MIIFFILIGLISLGILISKKFYDYEMLVDLLIICSSLLLLLHIVCVSLVEYDFDRWVVKRNSFELTLKECRKNGSEIELASIQNKVVEFNEDLATAKFSKTYSILSCYISDRVINLKPIK